jgi:hypothetical protein
MSFTQEIQDQIYDNIRGCVLNLDGSVNYYLDSDDWTLKEDGVTSSNLTGADGYVMVEIPKFWYRRADVGTVYTWEISTAAVVGYTLHPAFIKDGVEVNHRYIGAYDACFWDATDGLYKSGLNLDNAGSLLDYNTDKLASISGVYPLVGVTRSQCRSLASNNGAGWRQLDFALASAIQMLYLIEYQTFFSQNVLGAGNTNGSYFGSSSDQNDSPHTVSGAGNNIGNGSTDIISGAGVNQKPGISFMKYRGIENLFGNCWNWVDGINTNIGTAGTVYYTNNSVAFVDNTSANMELLSENLSTGSDFAKDILPIDFGFLPSVVGGGATSTTYVTDRLFGSGSSDRVALLGGAANRGADAGVFCWSLDSASSLRSRGLGARVCF